MKSLLLLWQKLAEESASRCCTSAPMDINTVRRRSKNEGKSFLTITLPAYGKAIQRWLDQGYVDRHSETSFRFGKRDRSGLPLFLGGYLDQIFDPSSGVLLDNPSIDAIQATQQLTLVFGKMFLLSSQKRERRAMEEYVECEKEVKEVSHGFSPIDLEAFERMANRLFWRAFTKVDKQIYYNEYPFVPKHGPGATADGLHGNAKYYQNQWPLRLEEYFPAGEYLLPSWSYYDQLDEVDFLEPEAEIPVKVISVPKTMKTPRIIGVEPTAMQYAQQAVLPAILEALSGDYHLRKMLGFDDQVPNQELAKIGSEYGQLATLDLSEASDRVSNVLVETMLSRHPHLRGAIMACRSQRARVPGHGVINLSKFASMGSALCFPVEAMVFLTLVFMGIEDELNTPLAYKSFDGFVNQVRIYGDDIIVPVKYVRSVISSLHSYGAKVNERKSFWTGRYRESCGKEFYDGHDISIVKVRQEFPTSRKDATELISLVSLRNQLYFQGYWQTVKWLDVKIREIISDFPTVLPTSQVLGRHSFLGFETQRMCPTLHRPLVKGYAVRGTIPVNPVDGHHALLKFFLKRSVEPLDENHLMRSGRSSSVNTKRGWFTPY